MLYAKSEPIESIKEHTDKLIEQYEIIKELYGKEILENKEINEERFWNILKIACLYHDVR
ncbi:MAG: hypothetical protein HFJ58_05200 [Clostridia bacterium]|nr:hypothetical protein [Clostridia bacterium]